MKRCAALLVLAIAVGTSVAQDAEVVVVPLDNRPFKVKEFEMVRLTGEGIAGSRIEIRFEGPVKLVATHNIVRRKNGEPLIGLSVKEFFLKPTERRRLVKAKIKVISPQGEEKETHYEFEID